MKKWYQIQILTTSDRCSKERGIKFDHMWATGVLICHVQWSLRWTCTFLCADNTDSQTDWSPYFTLAMPLNRNGQPRFYSTQKVGLELWITHNSWTIGQLIKPYPGYVYKCSKQATASEKLRPASLALCYDHYEPLMNNHIQAIANILYFAVSNSHLPCRYWQILNSYFRLWPIKFTVITVN